LHSLRSKRVFLGETLGFGVVLIGGLGHSGHRYATG
jgi:hypothetical protein